MILMDIFIFKKIAHPNTLSLSDLLGSFCPLSDLLAMGVFICHLFLKHFSALENMAKQYRK